MKQADKQVKCKRPTDEGEARKQPSKLALYKLKQTVKSLKISSNGR